MIPTVSVIIPLYNKEPHIKRTIDSVLAQKVHDFEIIIVDDGSTDKSADVVRELTDPRIRLIQQENAGVSAARNKGIEEAKADLIAFLDADDEWTPSFLETILRLREKYPQAGAYAAAYKKRSKNGTKDPKYYIPNVQLDGIIQNYFESLINGEPAVCSSSICIPKNILKEVGSFPNGIGLGEDLDMWGRIALKYPIAFSRQIGAIYHMEATNRACNNLKPIKEFQFVKSAKKAIEREEVKKELIEDLNEYISRLEIYAAGYNLILGERKAAWKILINCKTKLFYWTKIKYIMLLLVPLPIFRIMCKFLQKDM